MTARTMVALVGILIAAPSAAQQQAADLLERRASEIFVEGGDVLDFLPELVAQLEIPAALELGYLVPPGRLIERPGDQGPLVDLTVVPDERLIRRFEFARGTIGAALDTLCEKNPSLRWQASDGLIRIVRTGHRDAELDALLDRALHRFRVRDEPLHSALGRLTAAARLTHAGKPRATPWRWSLATTGRGSPVFPPRLPMDPSVSVERAESTLRQVLDNLVRQVEGAFWVAYIRKQGMPFPEPNRPDPGREGRLLVTRASPARRKLEVKILVRCLHRTYKPLHGYADVTVRIDDARRELKRRHHFHAKTVREAIPPEQIERLACAPNSWEAQQCLMWIFSLNDPVLSERAIGEVLALEEAERRFLLILVFPPPGPNAKHVPLWRRLSEDRDPRVRKWARNLLGAAKPE